MNQDNHVSEAFKMRNLLGELNGLSHRTSPVEQAMLKAAGAMSGAAAASDGKTSIKLPEKTNAAELHKKLVAIMSQVNKNTAATAGQLARLQYY